MWWDKQGDKWYVGGCPQAMHLPAIYGTNEGRNWTHWGLWAYSIFSETSRNYKYSGCRKDMKGCQRLLRVLSTRRIAAIAISAAFHQFRTFAWELPRQIQTSKWSKAPDTTQSPPGSVYREAMQSTPTFTNLWPPILQPNIKKNHHLKVTHPAPRNVFQTCASSPLQEHVLKWYAGRAEICECVALAPKRFLMMVIEWWLRMSTLDK